MRKDKSVLMKLISIIIWPLNREFMDFWTTIGIKWKQWIFYPAKIEDPMVDRYAGVREHEGMHCAQFAKYGLLLMGIAYTIFPLPFLWSGRWWIERGPYLNDIRNGRRSVESAADVLWKYYGYPYSKAKMIKWFNDNLDAKSISREGAKDESD